MDVEKELVYLICPVRAALEKEKEFLDSYVQKLESQDKIVHYPPRDVNQEDSIGLRILTEHSIALKKSKEVHIYWNGKSQGSFFDLGMAFMKEKPIYFANPSELDRKLEDADDFTKLAVRISKNVYNMAIYDKCIIYDKMLKRRSEISKSEKIVCNFKGIDKDFLFNLGMAFIIDKPILLENREEVELQRTPSKSFQNVLLELDKKYRQKQ